MRQLNRSFTVMLGVVGTLVMAAWAGVKYAVGGSSASSVSAADSDGEGRQSASDRIGLRESSSIFRPMSSTSSRIGVVRPMSSPGSHFMSAASLDAFGFPTPLGTLSALHPAARVNW